MNSPLITKIVNRDDLLSNNMVILNPKELIVMVLKRNRRTFFNNHSINTYLNMDNFLF